MDLINLTQNKFSLCVYLSFFLRNNTEKYVFYSNFPRDF